MIFRKEDNFCNTLELRLVRSNLGKLITLLYNLFKPLIVNKSLYV